MSSEIVRRVAGGIDRVPRRVGRAIEVQRHRGLESAARVKAAAYVAHMGISLTAQLSAEEASLIQMVPLAEPRMKGIVDSFSLLVSVEVAGMAL